MKTHKYHLAVTWTGNKGKGTIGYRDYERSYDINVDGKQILQGSADAVFLGDPTKYNPEELLLASISSCHMLWYLHLCAEAGVVVDAYTDQAKGTMIETENGGGKFEAITLYPTVTVLQQDVVEMASLLHKKANELCFIANSVNFKVLHEAVIIIK
jgi:organic hydroperoxide reductase OsmC/OhrA